MAWRRLERYLLEYLNILSQSNFSTGARAPLSLSLSFLHCVMRRGEYICKLWGNCRHGGAWRGRYARGVALREREASSSLTQSVVSSRRVHRNEAINQSTSVLCLMKILFFVTLKIKSPQNNFQNNLIRSCVPWRMYLSRNEKREGK